MRRIVVLLMLIAGCRGSPGYVPATAPSVSTDSLKRDLYWLADDDREGRAPGTVGIAAASRYLENRARHLHLQPVPALGDFRQPFTVNKGLKIFSDTVLSFGKVKLNLDTDFRPLALSANKNFSGKLALVGYGVVTEKYQYDDYANIDVKDHIVLAMRYEPHRSDGKSRFTNDEVSDAASISIKAKSAQAHGAKALLIVNPPEYHPDDAALIPFVKNGRAASVNGIPIISISSETASKLLGPQRSLLDIQKTIDTTGKPASELIDDISISGTVDIGPENVETYNIISELPGKGPHADEYVVVGAHYDHIGRGYTGSRKSGSTEIHNGADDNASGTTALIHLEEQIAKTGAQDRTILFVSFSGEEMGLLGSKYFVDHPPVPLDKIEAMLNMDMVGRMRNNTLFIGGDGTSQSMKEILQSADDRSLLIFKSIGRGGLGPSDHASFARKQIPVVFLFTGLHPQYHRPEDDAPLINYDGLSQVVDVAFDLTLQLCHMPKEQYIGKYDAQGLNIFSTMEPTAQSSTTAPVTQPAEIRKATLGVIPDYETDQTTGGVRISGTTPGSPAEKIGLMDGDILIHFDKTRINSVHDLTDALNTHEPEQEIEIQYVRKGKTQTVRIRLAARNENR